MQAFILLIKKGKKSKQNSKTSFTWKRGEWKKKAKKQATTKTPTKPPVLIKHRVDSNPEKGEKAPDLMREGAGEEQNLHPTGIPTSSLWEQKIIRCCAEQRFYFLFYFIPVLSLFSKQAKGGGSKVLALGGPTTAGMKKVFWNMVYPK